MIIKTANKKNTEPFSLKTYLSNVNKNKLSRFFKIKA